MDAGGNSLLDLDLDIGIVPIAKTHTKNQISLSCYGRGRRFCDLRIPAMPRSAITLSMSNKNDMMSSEARAKPGRGRGRRQRSVVGDDHSSNPGSLQEKSYVSSDSRSVCSDQSSRDSEHFLAVENQQASRLSPRLQSSSQHDNTDAFPQTPSNNLAFTEHGKYITDSPPLKVLDGWTLTPPMVVQFEGIPLDYDLNVLHELLSFYGSIIDWEEKRIDGELLLRMKFEKADVCELIELNIDKSDFTGTEDRVIEYNEAWTQRECWERMSCCSQVPAVFEFNCCPCS